jgi:hypothetical protein
LRARPRGTRVALPTRVSPGIDRKKTKGVQMTMKSMKWGAAGMVAAVLAGCAGADFDDVSGKGGKGDFKGDAIDAANDPARFDPSLERRFDRLPARGEAKNIPWAGDYWASASDSINVRWDGSEASPAEKYAQAFGRAGVPDAVSSYVGLKSSTETIPGWVGICEGWSAAAIRELPPLHEVVRGGVTFYPGDIEGLLSLLYARGNSSSKFLARRCNDEHVRFDENGRAVAANCRDANPGALHIIVTNFLGVRGEGFVEDRTYDSEVWNQPVRGYDITSQKEITLAEAADLVGGAGATGTHETVLSSQALAAGAQKTGKVIMPAGGVLHLNLSGDGDADLYVNEGAPAGEGAFTCRPYASNSNESCTVRAAAGTEIHWMVTGYAASSTVQLVSTVPSGNATYAFNPAAVRFAEVKMDLHYISESSPARGNHVSTIDQYTRTDHYHYVLELDADGTIIGGEYVGDSRSAHPDFLWLPVGSPLGEVAGIRYNEVKSLLDESRR